MNTKLLIGTKNTGKYNEIANFFHEQNIETVSLNELGITDDVEETGQTFAENALLKASYYCQRSGLPTLADDGGLEITALNGEPGVKSRRWKGYTMTDQELVDHTLERLQGVAPEQRTAQLVLVLALVCPDQYEFTVRDCLEGKITEKIETPIITGFPFRSIFFIPELNKTFSELTPAEHAHINHRRRALLKMLEILKKPRA